MNLKETANELSKNSYKENHPEVFKPIMIDDEATKYVVSNYGRVINTKNGKEIKTHEQNSGYYGFTISHKGKSHSFKIARMVALLFINNDDPDTKIQVDHINGNKSDNGVWNLEWVTPSENQQRSIANGTFKDCCAIKTDEETIEKVCAMLEKGCDNNTIMNETGVPYSILYKIKNKSTFTNISKKYDFSNVKSQSGKKAAIPDETVHEICKLWLDGKLASEISLQLNIPENTVYGIVYKTYKSYVDIVNQYDFSKRGAKKNKNSLSDDVVHTICKMICEGKDVKTISDLTGVSTGGITKIKRKERRTDISSQYNF